MKKEAKKILNELKNEMLTQKNFGQANPRFWVVREKKRIYTSDAYASNVEIIWESEPVGENLEELLKYLKESGYDEYLEKIKYSYDPDNLESVIEELSRYINIELAYFIDEYQIVENTMFLTFEECKKHIEANSHHYNEPLPYCMTAWRSPQVKKLFEILQNTNWEE